jgi:hypothetical protein
MERTVMTESKIDNHLVMVELVGPRFGRPAHDAATTLPFQREELDTEKVLKVAPIDDETLPDDPVQFEALAIQPSQPYALIEVAEPMVPIALDAHVNLVAFDQSATPTRAPSVTSPSRFREVAIAAAFLVGALAAGVGLSFLIAAVAR